MSNKDSTVNTEMGMWDEMDDKAAPENPETKELNKNEKYVALNDDQIVEEFGNITRELYARKFNSITINSMIRDAVAQYKDIITEREKGQMADQNLNTVTVEWTSAPVDLSIAKKPFFATAKKTTDLDSKYKYDFAFEDIDYEYPDQSQTTCIGHYNGVLFDGQVCFARKGTVQKQWYLVNKDAKDGLSIISKNVANELLGIVG